MMIDRCQPFWNLKYILKQPIARTGASPAAGRVLQLRGDQVVQLFDGSKKVVRYLWHVLDIEVGGRRPLSWGGRQGRHTRPTRREVAAEELGHGWRPRETASKGGGSDE